MKQGSQEWLTLRAGKITGSRFSKAMARKNSKAYGDFVDQLVQERRLNRSLDGDFVNDAMQWGMDNEPKARRWYARQKDCTIQEVPFVAHSELEHVGVSPDGLVGRVGLIEIKCPQRPGFEQVLESGAMPTRYRWQVQGGLWVCRRKWADFICFYPPREGVILRIPADENDFDRLEDRCKEVLLTVERRLSVGNAPAPRKATSRPAVQQSRPQAGNTTSPPPDREPLSVQQSDRWRSQQAQQDPKPTGRIPIWIWVVLIAVMVKFVAVILR